MTNPVAVLFLNHPRSVGMSYFRHQRLALWLAWALVVTAAASLVHAIVPALFARTAGDRIARFHGMLERAQAAQRAARPGP